MQSARLSAMTGFTATSNVAAAAAYGIEASGTMAHAYIEAFPDEETAFRAFARTHPGPVTFLVDTYDTATGVATAARVLRELESGPSGAIRLDSGDLGEQAVRARKILDAAGLPEVRIVASGGLDEYALEELVHAGAPIDVFAVGTRMGVSADAAALDTAYKLVDYDGTPVMKLSSAKATAPGTKQVWRRRLRRCDRRTRRASAQRRHATAGDRDARGQAHRSPRHPRPRAAAVRHRSRGAAAARPADPPPGPAPAGHLRRTGRPRGAGTPPDRAPAGGRRRGGRKTGSVTKEDAVPGVRTL
ncbi:hypothetical protein SANTM175S_02420 [Streptomyces antimycoticus]